MAEAVEKTEVVIVTPHGVAASEVVDHNPAHPALEPAIGITLKPLKADQAEEAGGQEPRRLDLDGLLLCAVDTRGWVAL